LIHILLREGTLSSGNVVEFSSTAYLLIPIANDLTGEMAP